MLRVWPVITDDGVTIPEEGAGRNCLASVAFFVKTAGKGLEIDGKIS